MGCGSDLPQSKKEIRNLTGDSTALSAIGDGILSTWSVLMKAVLGGQGLPLNVFAEENPGKMCKNCFKVYEN